MNRVSAACVLAVSVAGCSKATPPPEEQPSGQTPASMWTFHDGGVDLRKRLGSYVGSKLTPEFRECWGKIAGEGAVAIDLEFGKVDKTWAFERTVLKQSSLEKGQEATALGCLERAARGSSFAADPTDGLEAAAPRLLARHGWSVPLPVEGERLTPDVVARRFGGGGPGAITVAGCSTCVLQKYPLSGYKCEARDNGSERDCEERPPNSCVTTPEACVKDIIYGVSGGIIMY